MDVRAIDLFNESHLKKIILEIDGEQNKRRKRTAWKAYQCLEGNQKEYVNKQLQALYPKSFEKFRKGDINVVGKVNHKLSKAYKNQPIRKCATDTEDENLATIYDENHFDRAFTEADSIYNLHKYVCLWLVWQNADKTLGIEKGRYVLHALAPYEYDLVRDQVTGEPVIFALNYPESSVTQLAGKTDGIEQTITESQSDTSAQSQIYTFWNSTQYSKVVVKKADTGTDEITSISFIDKKPNVLNTLPITYLQKDTGVDYPVATNIAEQSIDWNVGLSDLKTASASQGHGQLVISHPEDQKTKNVHMGMHTAIGLPQSKKPEAKPTTAEYISASPDLAGQLEVLKFDIVNILDDYGIKAKGTIEGGVDQFTSGFDRLLSEADVQDKVETNQGLYTTSIEQGTFTVLKASEEAMSQNTFKKTTSLEVTFEKPKVLISDAETIANIKARDEQGLILPWEKHIIMNPNLTDTQAKAREEEIQKGKQEKLKEQAALLGEEVIEEDEEE